VEAVASHRVEELHEDNRCSATAVCRLGHRSEITAMQARAIFEWPTVLVQKDRDRGPLRTRVMDCVLLVEVAQGKLLNQRKRSPERR